MGSTPAGATKIYMTNEVYIVKNLELGWDDIVGAYDANKVTLEELLVAYPEESKYVIFTFSIESEILS